jgi:hypothetical protein
MDSRLSLRYRVLPLDIPVLPYALAPTDLPVVPFGRSGFACCDVQITGRIRAVSHPKRGALRGRHERWERDAVDAFDAQDERMDRRTAKSCGPDASTLASSRQKRFPPMMVTKKPDHQGDHEGNR